MDLYISAEIKTGHNGYVLDQKQNDQRTERLYKQLLYSGYKFEEVKGCYGGRKERSFLVHNVSYKQVDTLHNIALAYQQESVLFVDSFDTGFFVDEKGYFHEAGQLVTTTVDNIKYLTDYTVINSVQVAYLK